MRTHLKYLFEFFKDFRQKIKKIFYRSNVVYKEIQIIHVPKAALSEMYLIISRLFAH